MAAVGIKVAEIRGRRCRLVGDPMADEMDAGVDNRMALETKMITQMIKLTGNTVTLLTNTPKNIGTKIDLKVRLPKGSLLESFILSGKIIRCRPVTVKNDELPGYVLEVKLGDISPMNKNILDAYVDFIERRNMLKGIKVDFKALENVMSDFREKLTQLRETSELLRNNVKATLELLIRNAGGKTTIH
jgi:hypothetical protein